MALKVKTKLKVVRVKPGIMKLRLKRAFVDGQGRLCAEAIETWSGRTVVTGGLGTYHGRVVIEKGMEHLFKAESKGRKDG